MIEHRTYLVCVLTVLSISLSGNAALAQCGVASWYHEGARTANGERYKPDGISAAHRSLPFGTRVKVTHKRTGRSVVVRINDRGPFIRNRIIDLSRGAKRALGMSSLASVCLTVLGRGERHASARSRHAEHTAKPALQKNDVDYSKTSGWVAKQERQAGQTPPRDKKEAGVFRERSKSSFTPDNWPRTSGNS